MAPCWSRMAVVLRGEAGWETRVPDSSNRLTVQVYVEIAKTGLVTKHARTKSILLLAWLKHPLHEHTT